MDISTLSLARAQFVASLSFLAFFLAFSLALAWVLLFFKIRARWSGANTAAKSMPLSSRPNCAQKRVPASRKPGDCSRLPSRMNTSGRIAAMSAGSFCS